jgi:hypothetical protein
VWSPNFETVRNHPVALRGNGGCRVTPSWRSRFSQSRGRGSLSGPLDAQVKTLVLKLLQPQQRAEFQPLGV